MKRCRLIFRPSWLRWVSDGALLIVVSLSIGCAVGPAPTGTPRVETSPKLNPFVHFEEGRALFVAVDGNAAQYVKDGDALLPLGVGLANTGTRNLDFSRESFVLEDSAGRKYPVVGIEEFNRVHRRSRSDETLFESFAEIMRLRFYNSYTEVRWVFFPTSALNSTASDRMELPRMHDAKGYLYFPIPVEGVHGRAFRLLVTPTDGSETYVVRFVLK